MIGRDRVEGIKAYGERAMGKKIPCDVDACPRCGVRHEGFKRHGVRKRLFLVFTGWVIRPVCSYLTRWKCPLCQATFTRYPAFALPFKRYTAPFIVARCAGYVEDKARTYREGVEAGGVAVSYEDADSGTALWPSTLWRWVSALGGLAGTVRQGLCLIKQKDPSTGVFRALGAIRLREGKYRSAERNAVLQRCRALMIVERVYASLFQASLFPELATGRGFR